MPPPVLLLWAAAAGTVWRKIGDGQCNGGVGGTGEHKCLIGGSCNQGGNATGNPTDKGVSCPGVEYLLCHEDTSINRESCRAACSADAECVGFMVSHHLGKGSGRCELQTKAVEYAAEPLECYVRNSTEFHLIGLGACRTRLPTTSDPSGGHYGRMKVEWLDSLPACEAACLASNETCVGVEYHRTPSSVKEAHKCEVHFEELSADHMSVFECWIPAPPTPPPATPATQVQARGFEKVGDGQCNGGVGGTGEHKCLIGGSCNQGGQPFSHPTVKGTRCPGVSEYLLCHEDITIDREACHAACSRDVDCVGFMVSHHLGNGAGRCELQTKHIDYAAKPLECYIRVPGDDSLGLIGKGACRTRLPTTTDPTGGHYGRMRVEWVVSFAQCEAACRASNETCVGVEYHRTASQARGAHKCEVHFEELSAAHMSVFECWNRTAAGALPPPANAELETLSAAVRELRADNDALKGWACTMGYLAIAAIVVAGVAILAAAAAFHAARRAARGLGTAAVRLPGSGRSAASSAPRSLKPIDVEMAPDAGEGQRGAAPPAPPAQKLG